LTEGPSSFARIARIVKSRISAILLVALEDEAVVLEEAVEATLGESQLLLGRRLSSMGFHGRTQGLNCLTSSRDVERLSREMLCTEGMDAPVDMV
jgi:hypothetical protein